MAIPDALQIGVEIISIASFAAVVLTYIWNRSSTSAMKQTIENLQGLVESQGKTIDVLRSEREEFKLRIEKIENENQILRSLVTGEQKIAEVVGTIEAHHKETMVILDKIAHKIAA